MKIFYTTNFYLIIIALKKFSCPTIFVENIYSFKL